MVVPSQGAREVDWVVGARVNPAAAKVEVLVPSQGAREVVWVVGARVVPAEAVVVAAAAVVVVGARVVPELAVDLGMVVERAIEGMGCRAGLRAVSAAAKVEVLAQIRVAREVETVETAEAAEVATQRLALFQSAVACVDGRCVASRIDPWRNRHGHCGQCYTLKFAHRYRESVCGPWCRRRPTHQSTRFQTPHSQGRFQHQCPVVCGAA